MFPAQQLGGSHTPALEGPAAPSPAESILWNKGTLVLPPPGLERTTEWMCKGSSTPFSPGAALTPHLVSDPQTTINHDKIRGRRFPNSVATR